MMNNEELGRLINDLLKKDYVSYVSVWKRDDGLVIIQIYTREGCLGYKYELNPLQEFMAKNGFRLEIICAESKNTLMLQFKEINGR